MTHRVAINGYGRVGRAILRAFHESRQWDGVEIVAVNDLSDIAHAAHLTRHDTVHGMFPGTIAVDGDRMIVDGNAVTVLSEADPGSLPWGAMGIDLVLECSGRFTSREDSASHLKAGAGKVLISAPAGNDVDATIVYGVNHQLLTAGHRVVSNASCTTNCLAPLAKPLHETIGIEHGLMTTVHAFTNDQLLLDGYHKDLRRARGATQSMIPTRTGAAAAVGLVLPELRGRLDGYAIRVPTVNVSLVDLTFHASRETTVDEVNNTLRAAAGDELQGILRISDEPLVSMDFNHTTPSAIVDAALTRVTGGRMVKVCAWYDNEWAFAHRMLDTAVAMLSAS